MSTKRSHFSFLRSFSSEEKRKMNVEVNESTHPHVVPNHMISFPPWKIKGECLQIVQAALFDTIKMDDNSHLQYKNTS